MERYIAFLKVLETGSFTKAAALLGYTQPALSQMIASLEKELQVKLLRRSRTGVSLTPEGSQLLAPIQSSVEQYPAMRRAAWCESVASRASRATGCRRSSASFGKTTPGCRSSFTRVTTLAFQSGCAKAGLPLAS